VLPYLSSVVPGELERVGEKGMAARFATKEQGRTQAKGRVAGVERLTRYPGTHALGARRDWRGEGSLA